MSSLKPVSIQTTTNNKTSASHDLRVQPNAEKPIGQNALVQETTPAVAEYQGNDHTQNDRRDMFRMGKKQELRRNFRFLTILGFVALAMGTWEIILASTASGLANGGTAGQIWIFLASFFCFGTIVLSLAEMSSIAPTAGGQYHWASEFAPASSQKFISYMSGWMSTLSWQCGTCSGMFLLGGQVQELAALAHPSYSPTPAQAYGMMVAFVTIGLFINTIGAKQLPLIEGLMLVLHIFGWIATIAVLWSMGPKNSAHSVFTSFDVSSGWSPTGLGLLVGQVTVIYGLIGSDGAAHLAEETKDAGLIVPRSMVYSYLLNCTLGFIMLITYCFCITDLQYALDNGGGFPYIVVFKGATGSTGGAIGLSTLVIILVAGGAVSFFTSASRQLFAFARDKGVPGYRWVARIHPRMLIPLNAIIVTFLFTVLLCLINIGSTTAFNAIIGLQLIALLSTYAISIGCLALKRIRGEPLPPARWSLGKFGLPINLFAFTYAIFACVFVLFPTTRPITAQNMNWAVVMFFGVLALAIVYYFIHGRKVYHGPVKYVKQFDRGDEEKRAEP